jgi:hypothetical protein
MISPSAMEPNSAGHNAHLQCTPGNLGRDPGRVIRAGGDKGVILRRRRFRGLLGCILFTLWVEAVGWTAPSLPESGAALSLRPSLGPKISLNPRQVPRDVLDRRPESRGRRFELRMGVEQLRNPYWYEEHGQLEEARRFWDRSDWESRLKAWSKEGYNAVLYWVEPWTEHAWQTFLIRHREFPEARELTPEQSDRIIAHVNWIFRRAHQFGLKNYLFSYFVVTTRPFARAHRMDREMPLSSSVDLRHNMKGQMGFHFGVRNEQTRAFTESAIAELFQTYKDLDGLNGGMGEALPGERSTWYREAVAPGLKRSGRHPRFIVMNWMLPLEDFVEEVAPPAVYDNTWVSIMANGEMFTDARPYPNTLRWAERAGVPNIIEIVHHNFEAGFPFNSPRLAHEILTEYRKIDHCRGYLAWFLRSDPNYLLRAALGYYGKNDVPYSNKPWVDLLEERFGDRKAAEHFLRAFDASARITPEVSAIAWCPHDLGTSRQLMLPYWFWTEEDPRWSYFASPARGSSLLPLRHYARVVARLGPGFRDNNGADAARNPEHPGAQELIWGLGDYPTTPEAHMRKIRLLGEECLREAEAARRTVRKNADEAEAVLNFMKGYKLLADYYEKKVLAAVAALIYGFSDGGDRTSRIEAERLADEAVERYEAAIAFIWEKIDQKRGNIQVRGLGGKVFKLPDLIENEKQERAELSRLFRWRAQ